MATPAQKQKTQNAERKVRNHDKIKKLMLEIEAKTMISKKYELVEDDENGGENEGYENY